MLKRLILVLAVCLCGAWATAAPRSNILWLIAEDMGPQLACYGTQQVWTPALDKLAAEGARFTLAFTTAPVCSASRSAFNTGLYQTTLGAHNHRSHRDDGFALPANVKIISHRMAEAGYFTANVVDLPASCGFKGSGKTDWNFNYEGKPYQSKDWAELKGHQPFYAQINFKESHRTYHSPAKADPEKVVIPPYYPDHPVTRKDWAQYLDEITEFDRKVGLVLQQLEADGMAENTLVVVMGDHGQSMVRGKQFCYDEGLHIPLLMRWPKALPVAEGFKKGGVDDRLVEAIDLPATFLDLAGVKKPEGMQGRVLFGPRREPDRPYAFGARDRCDETVFRFRTARDHQFRYIHNFMPERPFLQPNRYKESQYPVWNLLKELDQEGKLNETQKFLTAPHMPAEELYDIKADPYQIHNLAGDPKYADVLVKMRGVTDQWIEQSNDQGRIAEPTELIQKLQNERQPAEGEKSKKKNKKGKKNK